MRKLIILLLFLPSILFGQLKNTIAGYEYNGPKIAVHWYYPCMTKNQADSITGYDMFIFHNELIYKKSEMIDYLISKNPGAKMLVYVNPVEWFIPSYGDSPWSKKMLQKLTTEEYEKWWLLQPNGQPAIFWISLADGRKTHMMNMGFNCPLVNGEKYYEYIAHSICSDVLSDKRINGILLDNSWNTIYWLGNNKKNLGLDFDRDGQTDKDSAEMELAWQRGEMGLAKIIRQTKGPDFIMIGNPEILAYSVVFDGKQYEDWPFRYAGDTINGGWNISMSNIIKTGSYSIVNAGKNNWFFTLCSALLLDNIYFSDQQNMPYQNKYKIVLGKPLESRPNDFMDYAKIYSRAYERGTVYVDPVNKESWISDPQGNLIYNKKGCLIKNND
jgi:hypothetical protein